MKSMESKGNRAHRKNPGELSLDEMWVDTEETFQAIENVLEGGE